MKKYAITLMVAVIAGLTIHGGAPANAEVPSAPTPQQQCSRNPLCDPNSVLASDTFTSTSPFTKVQDSAGCLAQFEAQQGINIPPTPTGPCAPAPNVTAGAVIYCTHGVDLNRISYFLLGRAVYAGYFILGCSVPTFFAECEVSQVGVIIPSAGVGFNFGSTGCDAIVIPVAAAIVGAPVAIAGAGLVADANGDIYYGPVEEQLTHA